jgi:hypothetical protein
MKHIMELQFALAFQAPFSGGLGMSIEYSDTLTIEEALEWWELLKRQRRLLKPKKSK